MSLPSNELKLYSCYMSQQIEEKNVCRSVRMLLKNVCPAVPIKRLVKLVYPVKKLLLLQLSLVNIHIFLSDLRYILYTFLVKTSLLLATFGCLCLLFFFTTFGHFWLLLATFSYFWLRFSYFWLLLATFGYFWLLFC